jgi:Uma2 family endonuclease
VVEVLSESTEAQDRGVKFEDFATNGVTEYWLVDTEAETVEQYLLDQNQFLLAIKSGTGTLTSRAIHGLVIPVRAIFDERENLEAIRSLLHE